MCVAYHLRTLRRGDFQTLWEIDQRCFPPGISYSREELTAYVLRRGAFTIVAESDQQEVKQELEIKSKSDSQVPRPENAQPEVVGFIVAEVSRGVGHIITIDVLPHARHSGLGSQLLKAAEDRLKLAKCNTVILEAAVDNHSALAFYKKHGYVILKSIPRYYPNGVNAFVLRKSLLSAAQAS